MTWQGILGGFLAAALAVFLLWRFRKSEIARQAAPMAFFGRALEVVENAELTGTGGAGLPRLSGRYKSHAIQIHPVTDTLAIRKIPALWLLVTVQSPLPVTAKFDMMMRPAGPTTFSNFDLLPHTIKPAPDFPAEAVIRSDDPAAALPCHVVAPHLDLFDNRRAKELLIAPQGLRIVWLLAEADRARYGVFRQAEFGDVVLDAALLTDLLDRLIALRQSILDWHAETT